jgi:hypothetical protein
VWWYGTNGEIKYNDRLGIREALTNLAYYVPVFNNWILAAQTPLPTTSGGVNPAITVPQARTVKVSLVDGLFFNKSSPPDISGTSDASANASANAVASGMTSKINAAIGQINTAIDTINSGVASVSSGSNTAISDLLSSVQAAINSLNSSLSTFATGDSANNTILQNAITQLNLVIAGLTASAVSSLGAIGYPGMNNVSVMLPSAPAGASHASAISATTVSQTTADDPLQVQRAAHHKTALAGISTVPALAAYDITAGW